jgi:small subunit ribosomal protein S1
LIHTSEHDAENQAPAEGTEIEFVVLRVDHAERRFELSQRAASRGLDDNHQKMIQQAIETPAATGFADAFAKAQKKTNE